MEDSRIIEIEKMLAQISRIMTNLDEKELKEELDEKELEAFDDNIRILRQQIRYSLYQLQRVDGLFI